MLNLIYTENGEIWRDLIPSFSAYIKRNIRQDSVHRNRVRFVILCLQSALIFSPFSVEKGVFLCVE